MRLSDQQITLSQLEGHLWESANILRGPVDAADFKTYIFPLLFFKRICDVWDEEYQEIVDETGDEQLAWFPESHRFQIPEDCHWNDVRTKASNVGTALQRAMREIEKANPDTLYGVFGDAQWSNKDRLSDALLKDLIEHFSKLPFGNKNVNSDLLGDAYEYLIKKFADATNKKAGEFYTPRSVVRLMIDMLDPKEAETIYDPACGTGGMLLAAVQHVKEQHGDVKRLWGKLYGQEKNLTTSSIARMNLFLHGIEDFQVVRGDTLRNPAFFEVDRLATFDCVIANPPFSLEKWGEDLWLNDPFGRNFAGLPPSSSGDFAWVQHMVKSMADVSGRMAVVLPQGALFRKGVEGSIRQKLLEMDLVEAVIGLAPNLFYGTGLAACILVLRKRKPVKHKKKVLIADASRLFRRGRAQNYLEPEHAAEILGWYRGFADVQDAVRVVGLDEIKAEDWTLNISRYVLPPLQEDIPPLPDAIAAFKDALTRCREAEERLAQVMTNSHESCATPRTMEDTEGVCGRAWVEVGQTFDGTLTAIPNLTRRRPLVPWIACGRCPDPVGSVHA
ncbi:type I restriction-modification system methyltransferase subunit [Serpentinimonas raichei]|uniref:site-specific DNA-methyltransferase (adenine-specific) n=1 Tax=Serpentinimonas raichei TaxID=1458425 RepID=A0A060NHE5_9BURK|nr:class I SAM-dependent DNA methyltransferase [Serpentinimonas raichei]BAO81301.1 type I restriction-modification system methyltransferase subunit [Serpentinimonas raichei]